MRGFHGVTERHPEDRARSRQIRKLGGLMHGTRDGSFKPPRAATRTKYNGSEQDLAQEDNQRACDNNWLETVMTAEHDAGNSNRKQHRADDTDRRMIAGETVVCRFRNRAVIHRGEKQGDEAYQVQMRIDRDMRSINDD